MMRVWGGLLLAALLVLALPVQADEVQDLKRMVQELKDEVAALKAERQVGSVERAVEEYLSSRAAEGGDLAGYMDGKFTLKSAEGDFKLNIGGRIHFDGRFYEPDGMQDNTFDLRRVRVSFSGQVGDGWGFKIQPDITTGKARLRDAYIKTKTSAVFGSTGSEYIDGITWKFGQFKQPFSLSELTSSNVIDTIERPTIVRAVAPSRDIGIQLSNKVFDDMLAWYLAISNGTNSVNSTDEFWYWARVVVAPFLDDEDSELKNLHVGLSFGTAHTKSGESFSFSTAGGGPYGVPGVPRDYMPLFAIDNEFSTFYPGLETRGRELLLGIDAMWFWQALCVKAEFIYAQQDVDQRAYETKSSSNGNGSSYPSFTLSDIGVSNVEVDDEVDTMGAYLMFAYMVTGEDWTEAPSSGLEAVAQIEWGEIDPGKDVDSGDFLAYTLGANYYFSKNARVMLNYVVTDFGDDTLRPIEEDGVVRSGGLDHNLLLRLQLTF